MINIKNGEVINGRRFAVVRADKKLTTTGKEYYVLKLADKSGETEAKIWSDSFASCAFGNEKVIEMNGKAEEYRGILSIRIDWCRIVDDEKVEDYSPTIKTMIFDIETIGIKFDELDEKDQKYLTENIYKNEEGAEEKTGLWWLFGEVAAIGTYDPDNKKGLTILRGSGILKPENDEFEYLILETEKELLERFWGVCGSYEKYVGYNSDSFDFPFLVLRSAVNRVKVPFEVRRYSDNFLDLQDKFKQSNRGFKLEHVCKALGIRNPKEEGVSGLEINNLWDKNDYQTIADYVSRDVWSTCQLYEVWKNYLSGKK